ncbi:hypothetical protein V5N11_032146 [Cardamine amara subsp. amara]|uniref:Uncharacterized protein n=1 Tax=Cardamine amara subsp. amara TaxID=228776 RepID=A0ABD1AAH5_CARAN
MTGQSSARTETSGKNKISSVANAGSSNLFAKEEHLARKYQILKEDHDILLKDYKFLEERSNIVNDLNEMMELHLPKTQNRPMEPDAKKLGLLNDLETERSEKEEYKKIVEGMKRMEIEKDAMINELRVKNQEVLIAKEKEEEEHKKMMAEEMKRKESEKEAMINDLKIKCHELSIAKEKQEEECKKIENKYGELTKRFDAVQTECSFLKSLYDAENAISQGGNDLAIKNDAIVVDDHNVSNTVADAIVISDDESDAENDNPPRKRNITGKRSVGKKKEECSNGANPPKVNHLPSPSSSSSSSDKQIFVQLPVKRSRDVYNRSLMQRTQRQKK